MKPAVTSHKAVVILGGGLAGWCLFEHLLQQGYAPEQLALVEKGVSARGASGVLRGMLHPFTGRTLYPKPGAMEAFAYARSWLERLQTAYLQNHDAPFYTSSALWRIAVTQDSQRQFERSFQRAQQELEHYPVSPQPMTTPLQHIHSAYVFPEAAHVNLSALLAYLQQEHLSSCFLHQQDTVLKPDSRGWQVKSRSLSLTAEHVVLAPGHELSRFFPHVPLRTKRGEVILFESPINLPVCVSGGGRYVVPLGVSKSTSAPLYRYIAGATFYRDDALWPPAQAWQDLCSRLHWFPELEKAVPLQVWSGVRATLHPDRQPLCGPVPGHERLWLMGAFSTRGLLQIPRHARALAQVLRAPADPSRLPPDSLPERVLRFKTSVRRQTQGEPEGVFALLH